MINIDKRMIQACLEVAPKQDIRYYLNGIKIEATKTQTVAVATDGHRLIAVRHEVSNDIDDDVCFIMPLNIAKISSKSKIQNLGFNKTETGLSVLLPDLGTIDFKGIEGKYPDWSGLVSRQYNPGARSGFFINGGYIGDFGKISNILNGSSHVMISHGSDDASGDCSMHLVGFEKIDFEAFGAVMGVRKMNTNVYPQDWVNPPSGRGE